MSGRMYAVLAVLRTHKASGFPFVALPGVHGRTLLSLQHRDWIVHSAGYDGVRYKITGRGEAALNVYRYNGHRTDGLCPRCGARPHPPRQSYCHPCNRAYRQERRRDHLR